MAIKLEFDSAKNVKSPTIVLSKRSGKKIGVIPSTEIHFTDNLNSYNSLSFNVSKMYGNVPTNLWDEIIDFKLVWCKEWDAWFEITVEIDESNELVKIINARSIGEAELSAIKLFDIQINTEDDIDLDDYVPTKLYDNENPKASLLNRITEKAPHYTIKHVDSTIKDIQRVFTFDNTSIYDAFQEISEEIGCLFVISQKSDENGYPERGIYVYDLQNYCNECGYRGDFYNGICPKCGSENITSGYGEDTTVFVSSENLADNIKLSSDTNQVNTCFKLDAGDDLMTASVMLSNPNGTEYLWYIPDNIKDDMSDELKDVLNNYDELYEYYQNEYPVSIDEDLLSHYNSIVEKYQDYDEAINTLSNKQGFSSLIDILYSTLDFQIYLKSGLLPTVEMSDTNASEQVELLNSESLSSISIANLHSASSSTVDLNVLSLAKAIVRSTYQVKIKESSYDPTLYIWRGKFSVTNYSDEDDTAESEEIMIEIDDDYSSFIRQKIEYVLNKEKTDECDTVSLFSKTCVYSHAIYSGEFVDELKKYCLDQLQSFHENCQSCLDILVEQGISDNETWLNAETNLYETFYEDYYTKLKAIECEIALRQDEIEIIESVYNEASEIRSSIQKSLDFKEFIGDDLWKEFCSYRREAIYSNRNYISDGLTNPQLLERAREFIDVANKELIKSATLQHSIDATLKNLLAIKGFEPILDYFCVGNWIRVKIDGEIYKLRLIGYTVDFDDIDSLSVEFSDVINSGNDVSDLKSIIDQASSMATSYQSIERQASKSEETTEIVNSWFEDGLDATLTKIVNSAIGQDMSFDEHGLLLRKFDPITEDYENEQMKLINSTIAITTDNWRTTKTAIGRFHYINPITEEMETAYGINGETIVGKMIIGETLGLYNETGSLTFDENGLAVSNANNSFIVNPSASSIVEILKGNSSIFNINTDGDLNLTGNINAKSGTIGSVNPFDISDNGFDGYYTAISGEYKIYQQNERIYPNSNDEYDTFTISYERQKDPENDNDNTSLKLLYISLNIMYSYETEETDEDIVIIDDLDLYDDSYEDEQLVGSSSSGTTTTTTNTVTRTNYITVPILYSEVDVSNEVVITYPTNKVHYRYEHDFHENDMDTYVKNLVINNDANLGSNYPLADITILNVFAFVRYGRSFAQFNQYTHIGSDYFKYGESFRIEDGNVAVKDIEVDNIKVNNDIIVINSISCKKDDDITSWSISSNASDENGYFEISTSYTNDSLDNDRHYIPIRIKQYNYISNHCYERTLQLLDKDGNTRIPKSLICTSFKANTSNGYIDFDGQVSLNNKTTWLGRSTVGTERRLRISSANSNGTYAHDMFIYGGNASSKTAFGIFNAITNKAIFLYTDDNDSISVANASHFYFKDWGGTTRKPLASATTDTKRMACIGSNSNGLILIGQWETSNFSTKYLSVPSSDIRLKKNIAQTEIKSAIDVLNKISLRSFDWKDGKGHQKIGFIADELEKIDDKLSIGGGYNKDGTMNVKSVNDFYMLGYIVKAIQELYEMIKEGNK